jgi:hypothetical protein
MVDSVSLMPFPFGATVGSNGRKGGTHSVWHSERPFEPRGNHTLLQFQQQPLMSLTIMEGRGYDEEIQGRHEPSVGADDIPSQL